MFENIGGKIKNLAKILCWVGIIISVIFALAMFGSYGGAAGIIYLFLGPLMAWISSFCLYGFGELVENSCRISCYIQKKEAKEDME